MLIAYLMRKFKKIMFVNNTAGVRKQTVVFSNVLYSFKNS